MSSNVNAAKYIDWLDFNWPSEYLPEGYYSTNIDDIPRELETPYVKALKFFTYYIPEFWKYFDLLEVVSISLLFKQAFYTAYYDNIQGFRYFCDDIWKNRTLDYRKFSSITKTQFIAIQKAFPALKQIFPHNIPRTILNHIKHRPNHLEFELDNNYPPFVRPTFPLQFVRQLTLRGCSSITMSQVLDIICTFQYTSRLTLRQMYINELFVTILRILRLRDITISESFMSPFLGFELGRTLYKSKDSLTHIRINADNTTFEGAVQYLLLNIVSFKKLKSLHFDMKLTHQNIVKLFNVRKSRSLTLITISEIFTDVGNKKIKYIEDTLRSDKMEIIVFPSTCSIKIY